MRKALGRDDIWGVGLPMSASSDPADTRLDFLQFVHAYEADYVTGDGRLVIDEPSVRAALIQALAGYTAIHRRGCTPPDAVDWRSGADNNEAFLAQRVVMTINDTLSIPNALRAARPEDYYEHAVTIAWPEGAYGQPLAIYSGVYQAVVFSSPLTKSRLADSLRPWRCRGRAWRWGGRASGRRT